MCHASKNHFMNNFGLSKCSEIRTCLTKECQEKRKSCEVRCGAETQCKVRLGGRHESHWTSISAKGNHFTVHCTVKRKVCAGLKPIWLVQVWRQRDLESIVLDLRVRTYPPISAFTQTLFFNITSSGPYPWSILTDQSSFIVLLLCGQRWYSESKRFDRANLLWHFHQKNSQDKQFMQSYLSLMSIPEPSFHAETGKGSTWTNERQLVIRSPPRHSFHGCDSSGVCDRMRHPSPPGRRRTSAAARPPRRGPALPPAAAASGLGRERRPRGSPHGSRREGTRVGKLASCASCASLKS